MGIFDALQTAVSGMQVQGYSLNNISSNIANSQTIGYKRAETSFHDLVVSSGPDMPSSGGVGASTSVANGISGAYYQTGNPTNLAINGNGYFAVARRSPNGTAGSPFSPSEFYTRRGDFNVDANGNLMNGEGNFLLGFAVDPNSNVTMGGKASPIQIPQTPLPAKVTTKVTFSGNISGISASESADGTLAATTAAGTKITTANEDQFLKTSIPGGAMTFYDAAGNPVTVQVRLAKTQNSTSSSTATKYDVFYDNGADSDKWTSLGSRLTFDDKGQGTLVSTSSTDMSFKDKTYSGIEFEVSNLSNQGDPNQALPSFSAKADGAPPATVTGVSISNGRVFARYSDGQQVAIADVALARFKGEDGLKSEGAGLFSSTPDSGNPIYGIGGSTLSANGIEQSNADITKEFTLMISTQQAYTANAKVISTAQQMMNDMLNVIR